MPWSQLRFEDVGHRLRFVAFLLCYLPEIAIAQFLSWAVPIICRICIGYLPYCI